MVNNSPTLAQRKFWQMFARAGYLHQVQSTALDAEMSAEEIPWNIIKTLPDPPPWGEIDLLVNAAVAQELASTIEDGDVRDQIMEAADQAVLDEIDDICPRLPHRGPWPGPPMRALGIASELTLFANTLEAGTLRERISGIATRIVEVAYSGVEARKALASK
jgi:hypothetical protein